VLTNSRFDSSLLCCVVEMERVNNSSPSPYHIYRLFLYAMLYATPLFEISLLPFFTVELEILIQNPNELQSTLGKLEMCSSPGSFKKRFSTLILEFGIDADQKCHSGIQFF
jgi:hypothetical protein